jgi:hypothetical protein
MSKIDFQFAPDGMAGALDASAISLRSARKSAS